MIIGVQLYLKESTDLMNYKVVHMISIVSFYVTLSKNGFSIKAKSISKFLKKKEILKF